MPAVTEAIVSSAALKSIDPSRAVLRSEWGSCNPTTRRLSSQIPPRTSLLDSEVSGETATGSNGRAARSGAGRPRGPRDCKQPRLDQWAHLRDSLPAGDGAGRAQHQQRDPVLGEGPP